MFKDKCTHYTIFILLAIGAALVGGLLFLHSEWTPTPSTQRERSGNYITSQAVTPSASPLSINGTLTSGSLSIPVTIANTPQSREQGLSDTTALPANDGMLFVFDSPQITGFWMKDMQYPLDFVWMDSAMKIVSIDTNVAVDTYPKIFYPPQKIQYVLEVNAGFSTAHDLKVGQLFTLSQ